MLLRLLGRDWLLGRCCRSGSYRCSGSGSCWHGRISDWPINLRAGVVAAPLPLLLLDERLALLLHLRDALADRCSVGVDRRGSTDHGGVLHGARSEVAGILCARVPVRGHVGPLGAQAVALVQRLGFRSRGLDDRILLIDLFCLLRCSCAHGSDRSRNAVRAVKLIDLLLELLCPKQQLTANAVLFIIISRFVGDVRAQCISASNNVSNDRRLGLRV